MTTHLGTKPVVTEAPPVDAREPVARLLRDLRTGLSGLTTREAARRLQVSGPHALLLWVAGGLAWVAGTTNPAAAGAPFRSSIARIG